MMKRPSTYLAVTFAALAGLLAATASFADDDARDQAFARKALQEGRIKSLAEITEKVKPKLPGNILAVEIDVEDDGRIVYEFDVIDTSGKLMEVDVDAATGEILSIEDDD
ncbi:PepSY domain-containing protein [Hyphomicrobium sp. LHD-15]|uniref:PepSY domain-containing protein n=1 Tax=Hyphomicrobium sp. LHD-15 TaxID=3072142 RepID=UPI00281049A5|nr:PepSY domain-containing protein [Hyphomicrobium sp. LHD-15]MDQ8698710.1 PepSY domain-containing protein [Hyphomicrobium sp. LHD-15]